MPDSFVLFLYKKIVSIWQAVINLQEIFLNYVVCRIRGEMHGGYSVLYKLLKTTILQLKKVTATRCWGSDISAETAWSASYLFLSCEQVTWERDLTLW